jgi:hypothetical protein
MVDILNLRTAPDGTSSPSSERSADVDHQEEQGTNPGDSNSPPSLKDSIIAGLKSSQVQIPGDNVEDEEWKYTKTIPTSELLFILQEKALPMLSNKRLLS